MDEEVMCLKGEVNEKHVNLDPEDGTRVTTSTTPPTSCLFTDTSFDLLQSTDKLTMNQVNLDLSTHLTGIIGILTQIPATFLCSPMGCAKLTRSTQLVNGDCVIRCVMAYSHCCCDAMEKNQLMSSQWVIMKTNMRYWVLTLG